MPEFQIIGEQRLWAEITESILAIDSEARIDVTESGLQSTLVDPANVAMGDIDVTSKAFESFDADDDIGLIGLNVSRFDDVIGSLDSDELIEVLFGGDRRLTIHSESGLEYRTGTIDPDTIRQEPEIPDLNLPATFEFHGHYLDRAVKMANIVNSGSSGPIAISALPDEQVIFDVQGDTDDCTLTLDRDDMESFECNGSEVLSYFSSDYVGELSKPIPSDARVKVQLGDEFSCKISRQFADKCGRVLNMLAPRIMSD